MVLTQATHPKRLQDASHHDRIEPFTSFPQIERDTPLLKMDGQNPRCGTMNAPNSPVYCVPSETHSVSGPPTLTCRVIARSPLGRHSAAHRARYPRGRTHTQVYFIHYRRAECNFFSDSLHATALPTSCGQTHVETIPDRNASANLRLATSHQHDMHCGERYGWFPQAPQSP